MYLMRTNKSIIYCFKPEFSIIEINSYLNNYVNKVFYFISDLLCYFSYYLNSLVFKI